MPRPIGKRLQGGVPILLKASDANSRDFELPLMIDEKDPWLLVSFAICTDTTFKNFAKIIGAPKPGRIPISMRFPGTGTWPPDMGLTIEMTKVWVTIACSLKFSPAANNNLEPVEDLAAMVQRQRKQEASEETWVVVKGQLVQEWRISTGVTFREFTKALGNHTDAMFQWRPTFLETIKKGKIPEAKILRTISTQSFSGRAGLVN